MIKKLKQILLFVTCLMMFFCVALFAACGGDKNCNHEYGDWKIEKEATCTEKGLKTRSCSKCNDVEAEEIPAGHKGTLYCTACNKTFVDDNFTSAFNNSFGTIKKNSGIEASISDISCYKKYNEYNLKNFKAFAGLDSEGKLFAYGNVDFTGKEGKNVGTISAQFVLKDNKIYYYTSMSGTVDTGEEYDIIDIAESITDEIDSEKLKTEDVAKILNIVISNLPTFVNEDVSAIKDKLTESVKTGMLITKIAPLDCIVDLSEENGNYVLSKKPTVFSDFVDDFVNLKAMDFIKKYLGNEVAKLISDTPNLLSKKVSELLTDLAANGVTVDDVVALLDECAKIYSDDEYATFESLTEIDIVDKVDQYKNKTIVDIIYDLVRKESSSITKNMIENQVIGAVSKLTAKTLPQMICEDEDDLKNFNESVVEIRKAAVVIDETSSYNYTFAKDGKSCGKATAEFKPYRFANEFTDAVDDVKFAENLTIKGEVVFGATPNASSAKVDVDALIKKVSDKVAADKEDNM